MFVENVCWVSVIGMGLLGRDGILMPIVMEIEMLIWIGLLVGMGNIGCKIESFL